MTRAQAITLAEEIVHAVVSAARGCYQEALVMGRARWSGADLRGRASKYGRHYARSRDSVLERANEALPAGWSIATRIDSTRRGQRRAVLYGPGVKLDWDTVDADDVAEAILTQAWQAEARWGLRVEAPVRYEADGSLVGRGLELEPCGPIAEPTTGAERFRGLEL